MSRVRNYFLYATVVLLLVACSTSPTGRKQLMLVSSQDAISASKEAYTKVISPLNKEGKINSNPKVVKRVENITGRVIAQAVKDFPESRNWDWKITVIDDDETVNAWCMAGGKMAIYTGFIKKINPTDDEIAQVMGHEIAHALANHAAEKMSVAMASQLAIAGVAISTRNEKYQGLALSGAALASAVAIKLPNSRVAEAEADEIGIELAAKAGYDPYAAASLWGKMGKLSESNPPEFLSTHPSAGNRQQQLLKLAPKMMKFYQPEKQYPVYKF